MLPAMIDWTLCCLIGSSFASAHLTLTPASSKIFLFFFPDKGPTTSRECIGGEGVNRIANAVQVFPPLLLSFGFGLLSFYLGALRLSGSRRPSGDYGKHTVRLVTFVSFRRLLRVAKSAI